MLRFLNMDFSSLLAYVLAVILAMSVHEMAHGLVSLWFGDPTAKRMGRLSLNPLAHVDWVGLVCLMLFGFGWAKPVPVNPSYYKDAKTGMIWTSFAGPAANFLLSFVCVFLYYAVALFLPGFATSGVGNFFMELFSTTAVLSVGFGIFNLIPIPPLDGAKIFWAFLPDQEYYRFNRGKPWMTLVFILLIWSGLLNGPMAMMRQTVIEWFTQFSMMILGWFI